MGMLEKIIRVFLNSENSMVDERNGVIDSCC